MGVYGVETRQRNREDAMRSREYLDPIWGGFCLVRSYLEATAAIPTPTRGFPPRTIYRQFDNDTIGCVAYASFLYVPFLYEMAI